MAFVYILRHGIEDVFKIGRTINLDARRRALTTGSPVALEEFDCIETEEAPLCETYLHKLLRSKRSSESGAREFFRVGPEELRRAIQDTREFLDEFVEKKKEAEQFAVAETNGKTLRPTEADLDLYRQLIDCRGQLDQLTYERVSLETQLKARIGSAEGIDQVATWRSKVFSRVDVATLKIREPVIYEQFLKATRTRGLPAKVGPRPGAAGSTSRIGGRGDGWVAQIVSLGSMITSQINAGRCPVPMSYPVSMP